MSAMPRVLMEKGWVSTSSFQNLAGALRSIGQRQGDDLAVLGVFDLDKRISSVVYPESRCGDPGSGGRWTHILEDDQGTVDTSDGVVADPWDDGVGRRVAGVGHVGQRGGSRRSRGTQGAKSVYVEGKRCESGSR
jgi:hypothetical protein